MSSSFLARSRSAQRFLLETLVIWAGSSCPSCPWTGSLGSSAASASLGGSSCSGSSASSPASNGVAGLGEWATCRRRLNGRAKLDAAARFVDGGGESRGCCAEGGSC
ncbi:uncharacterized protein M421DRAFT_413202 [Didymella exigua CBS 183.55]|uniref:Uncharacterized protein n=1 Tax=Didymella exigua CBS 183.55 TaxID=1150837 RepID=A0A6A5R6D7_9PLEO|nr:uncharacterized protein M421DRAFT_413202 [Didymella exigua CBS 183.55]KAF1922296.1 hypothetical protein M421DRAFT_413202 [Didymella exigua CBS 183.55]